MSRKNQIKYCKKKKLKKGLTAEFDRAAEMFARNWASSHGYKLVPLELSDHYAHGM